MTSRPRRSADRATAAARIGAVALTLACVLACTPAQAAPDAAPEAAKGDAVLQLLKERGLLPQTDAVEASPLVRQVRDAASELVLSAMNFLGVRYRRGGNSAEEGFDFSGFTRYVFENSLGLVLPRRADQQAGLAGLLHVKRDDLRPGDLVFFNTMRHAFSHVGIYIGDGRFIHAPRSGSQVRIEDMREAYWTKRYNGARRAESEVGGTLAAIVPLSSAAAQPLGPGVAPPSAAVSALPATTSAPQPSATAAARSLTPGVMQPAPPTADTASPGSAPRS